MLSFISSIVFGFLKLDARSPHSISMILSWLDESIKMVSTLGFKTPNVEVTHEKTSSTMFFCDILLLMSPKALSQRGRISSLVRHVSATFETLNRKLPH